MVQRSKRFLAVSVVASLLGGSVTWAVALWTVPLGAYDVALHRDDGRFAIVLNRLPPSERAPRHGGLAMNEGDGIHDEYVVTIATLDVCSTADAGKVANVCGPASVTRTVGAMHRVAPISGVVSARAGPPLPASFSILRI